MDYEITPLKAEYAEKMHNIELECFSDPWSAQAFAEDSTNPQALYFVATQNNNILGYIGSRIVLGECYITNIAVRSDCRRQGIGRVLIQNMLSFAQQNNLDFVTLEVRQSNLPAIALYTSLGFSELGIRRGYYEKPIEDAIIMSRFRSEKNI